MKFKNTPKESDELIYEAISLFKKNKFKMALSIFDKLLKINPKSLIALSHKAATLYELSRFN